MTEPNCSTCALAITVSFFESERDNYPQREEMTWKDLGARLSRFDLRDTKSGPAWSPVRYRDGARRGNAGVESVTVAVSDVDDGTDPQAVHTRLAALGFEHRIHSTFSSTPEHPKFRVVIPLAEPLQPLEWPDVFPHLCALLSNGHTDPTTRDPSRLFYLPSAKPDGKTFAYSGHGRPVLASDLLKPPEEETPRPAPFKLGGDAKIPHGRHHDFIVSTAASLASRIEGLDEATLLRQLRGALGEALDDAPSHEHEVVEAARSALAKYGKRAIRPAAAIPDDLYLWKTVGYGENEHEVPRRAAFVEGILGAHRFITFRDTGEVLVYRDGRYMAGADSAVREWVEGRFSERGLTALTSFCTEVLNAVARRTYIDRSKVNPPGRLCLANGVLDLDTLQLSPHDPEAPFTVQLAVTYDSGATCPRFKALVEEVLPDAGAPDLLQESFAYILDHRLSYQVGFVAYGDGANGKGTVFGVLADLLGPELVCSIPLQELRGKFAGGTLYGKMLNLATELPRQRFDDTAMFKAITGGDLISGERKFRDAFVFRPTTRLVFTSNGLPPTGDYSEGFKRRWVMLSFPVFIPPGRRDPALPDKVRAESAGILNWALAGLQRLRDRGRFDPPETEVGREWRRLSDPLAAFVAAAVEKDCSSRVTKKELYAAYASYCESEGTVPQRANEVGARLPQLLAGIREANPRIGGARARVWVGIRLKGLQDIGNEAGAGTAGTPGTPGYIALGPSRQASKEEGESERPSQTQRAGRSAVPGLGWSINGEKVE
jgi:P4 family phage/plasmid primase-like protien